ncbi:hypothetical protein BJ508DRAFT_313851 [Ascobolus immersus RN42]|uniref:Uncharacterized protein n=1 Tax=Ascobolus immersus RN42 TaxID=1160509 RepID=A0A3N4HMP9_ASCIM|nr:hypothetical protein BJ508DRAFT_313851 [Ascobolus immersus RN42]
MTGKESLLRTPDSENEASRLNRRHKLTGEIWSLVMKLLFIYEELGSDARFAYARRIIAREDLESIRAMVQAEAGGLPVGEEFEQMGLRNFGGWNERVLLDNLRRFRVLALSCYKEAPPPLATLSRPLTPKSTKRKSRIGSVQATKASEEDREANESNFSLDKDRKEAFRQSLSKYPSPPSSVPGTPLSPVQSLRLRRHTTSVLPNTMATIAGSPLGATSVRTKKRAERKPVDEAGWDGIWTPEYQGDWKELDFEYTRYLTGRQPGCEPQMVGPTVAILNKYAENKFHRMLASFVAHPSSSAKNEVVCVPQGAFPASFITSHLRGENKMPPGYEIFGEMMDSPEGQLPQSLTDFHVFPVAYEIPPQVTSTPSDISIEELVDYAIAGSMGLPDIVTCFKAEHIGEMPFIERAIVNSLKLAGLWASNLYFRGMDRATAVSNLILFSPAYTKFSAREFGPGIYTTTRLLTALDYAKSNGVIFVFKDVDFRELEVWKPSDKEWVSLVQTHTGCGTPDRLPLAYKTADVRVGNLCKNNSDCCTGGSSTPVMGTEPQTLFCSPKSIATLRASLKAIIYLTIEPINERKDKNKARQAAGKAEKARSSKAAETPKREKSAKSSKSPKTPTSGKKKRQNKKRKTSSTST